MIRSLYRKVSGGCIGSFAGRGLGGLELCLELLVLGCFLICRGAVATVGLTLLAWSPALPTEIVPALLTVHVKATPIFLDRVLTLCVWGGGNGGM